MEKTNFTIVKESLKSHLNIPSNNYLDHIYFVIPDHDLDLDLNYDVFKDSKLNIKVIILGNNDLKINCFLNANLKSHYNHIEFEILAYANDNANIKIISNVDVELKTIDNKSKQTLIGVLLSDQAKILGEPNLKINSLNVNAKHSLRIGTLDKDEIFYLLTKGLPLEQAKQILINAIVTKLISNLSNEEQTWCFQKIKERIR